MDFELMNLERLDLTLNWPKKLGNYCVNQLVVH